MPDQTLEALAKKKLEDARKYWDELTIEAAKKVDQYAEVAAELLKEKAKDKLKEAVISLVPSLEAADQVSEALKQALPMDIKDQVSVMSEHLASVGAVIVEVALIEVVRQREIDAKEELSILHLQQATTPQDHAHLAVQESRDNAQRDRLDIRLAELQARFDERHADAQAADTKRLQEALQQKFDELRRQQELAILADRMELADERSR